tara:strand:+ start:258992 stop:259483 length:492 start_codon:yes stop_codon:yes gene_type:complete
MSAQHDQQTGPLSQHATCIALGETGILLRGGSGAGKSDLAFRLMQGRWQAKLVADDQTLVTREGDALWASAPPVLSGLLELRGLGLLQVTPLARVRLQLVVELVPRDHVPRIPEPAAISLCGLSLPRLSLHAFDVTAPDKVGLAAVLIPAHGFPGDDGVIGRI